ncbi:MAG: hypothetical protein ACRDKW_12485, partial [Actinomycetota bacterium]
AQDSPVARNGRYLCRSASSRQIAVPAYLLPVLRACGRGSRADIDESHRSEGLTTAEQEELCRENRTLRMERDLLQRAAAFFARDNEPTL